ncbi:MAG: 4-hydroxy-tetrahydrodipicolinate reductase [Thermoguttaceae bacterium]|nr:4-hydroxy-tetrahydrodipicolinate reductase [Thermoguttaceae bacterium]
MTEKTRVAIYGAAGRMGKRLIALAAADPALEVAAAVEMPGHPLLWADSGEVAGIGKNNVPLVDALPDAAAVDAVIDFSSPAALDAVLDLCRARNLALVYATTGLSDEQKEKLRAAADRTPVLWSPSMSLTVNLTMKLAQIAAEALADKDADVEIIEKHHRFKADAPSGTALKFGQLIAEKMNLTGETHGRSGKPGARPHNEIGYHAVRIGDNPGEHNVIFGLLGETMELTVKATNRDAYAVGALSAAKFLAGKAPGRLYGMDDVLNLR